METEINIVEILKDKPANTKLYSPLFSEVFFSHVSGGYIAVEHHGGTSLFLSSGRFYDYDGSEPLLFPSKEMRDWSKFAWKKGDVLVNKDGDVHIIFERFVDGTYCSFVGKYYLWKENNDTEQFYEKERLLTSDFNKANKEEAQTYINTIEEKLGSKLNRETLEIEKTQPEFKDGDIAWYIDEWFESPQRCIVKGCCNVSWFEGNEFNSSGWWIDYRYKPDYCERTKQHKIREESLFDTEQEALIALFEEFKDKVKRKLEFFNKESKKLGIKQELRLLL